MSKIDLHVHSTASDGRFTPAEIVGKAAERDLAVIALTDHDTVDGIVPAMEAARAFPGLRVIPGVEINTDVPTGEAHILGYFIDYTHQELLETLARLRRSRESRAQGMIDRLADLGLPLEWQFIRERAAGSSIGRPHIAQAMLEKGYISSFQEAFAKYIGRDGLAYVERDKITPVEAVEVIRRAGGIPVLAHPFTVKNPETIIIELKPAGLAGIEAYYGGYISGKTAKLVALAERYGLIVTGGSDYHGLDEYGDNMIGGTDVPVAAAERLISLAEQPG